MGSKDNAPAPEEPKREIQSWEEARCEAAPRGAARTALRADFAAARQLHQWADGRLLTETELDAGLARVAALTFG